MSLFGQQTSTNSLFGSNQNQQTPANPFAATGSTQPATQSGLFTNTNTNASQSGGGLFGSAPASSAPQTGGLFGSTTTSQGQTGGGLFGSATPAQTQQLGGGLFGSATASQPQQTGGGLFGSTTNTSQGGGLFGSSTATTGTSSGGLFGTANQQGSSLFGGQRTSQPQQTNSLFENTATSQTQPSKSLFGGNAQNQENQAPKPGLFGNLGNSSNNNQQQSSLFGGSTLRHGSLTMGQSQTQQQQTVPGVKIDVSQIRGTTRFNDLHEDLQKQIEQIDAFVQQQIAYKEQCDALMPALGEMVSSIQPDVEFVQSRLETCEVSVDNDSSALSNVKEVVSKDVENARISFRAAENLKLPQQYHYSGTLYGSSIHRFAVDAISSEPSPMDLLSFFDTSVTSLSSTLQKYQSNLAEIENHLGVVEANTAMQAQQLMFRRGKEGGARSRDDQITELANVLREFEGGILQVAETVGKVREGVVDVIETDNTRIGYGWR